MIYAVKAFFFALFLVSAQAAVISYPLQKIPDREFVAGILARAAKGMK